MNKKINKNFRKTFLYLILGGFLVKALKFVFCKNKKKIDNIQENFKDFVDEEKKEIKELKTGKESFLRYCHDTGNIFCDYFIPSENNDNRPKILKVRSLVVITVLLLFLKVAVTGCLFFLYPSAGKMQQDITKEILILINQDRNNNNLNSLSLNSVLSASAMAKADDMVVNNYFAHYSPEGKKPWDWISRNLYAYLFVGENLAMNFSSAKSAHKALMDSPSHKKNILNDRYDDIGLAMVTGEIDGKMTNVLVELFATRSQATLAVKDDSKIEIVVADIDKSEIVNTETKNETRVLSTENDSQETKQQKINVPENKIENIKNEQQQKIIPTEQVDLDNKVAFSSKTEEQETSLQEIQTVSEEELDDNLNKEISFAVPVNEKKIGIATMLVKTSKYIYLAFLLLMIVSLSLAIFIKITVQHKPAIIQTFIVILLIVGLLSVKVHFLENIVNSIAIL